MVPFSISPDEGRRHGKSIELRQSSETFQAVSQADSTKEKHRLGGIAPVAVNRSDSQGLRC
jgi:hypothetical protein